MMMNRIDTHFESLTGTASLDEKNLGYKLFAGISASEKTDFEFAFNNFGEAVLSCNNGDTFVTANGNLQNGKWSPGTTLTCLADGVASNIRADSVSLTAKPKIIENNVFEIIPIIGIHNWHVNETTVTTGVSTTTFNYTGTDLVHGIEIKSKPENNFTVSFGYSKYPMYYDASAYEFNIGYKF